MYVHIGICTNINMTNINGIIIRLSSKRIMKVAESPKTTSAEFSATTVDMTPVVHKQQPEDSSLNLHTRVQDLYPPPTSMKPLNSVPVGGANTDHVIKTLPLPPPLPNQQQSTSDTAANKSLRSPLSPTASTSANTTTQDIQAMDDCLTPVEGRTANTLYMGTGSSAVAAKHVVQQSKWGSSGKRRKKRVKSMSPKLVMENSDGDKLELKDPPSEDICHWLQLDVSENKEQNVHTGGLQQVSLSCDQPHDHPQTVARGDGDSYYREQSIHHQNNLLSNNAGECSLVTQRRTSLQAPSAGVQKQHSPSSGLPEMHCKH